MSKLFQQPIHFGNKNRALSPGDAHAAISTLGGLAVLKNVEIGLGLKVGTGIDLSAQTIVNLADGSAPTDAANMRVLRAAGDGVSISSNASGKLQLAQTGISAPLAGGGGLPLGIVIDPESFVIRGASLALADSVRLSSLSVNRVSGLAQPTLPTDVITRAYFDAHVGTGLKIVASVDLASHLPLDLSTSLVGQIIDGCTVTRDQRVLLTGQLSSVQNGIYLAVAGGPATRAPDFAAGLHAANSVMFCSFGASYAGMTFALCNSIGDVIGTDALLFTQFAGNGTQSAGLGLTQQGSTLSVNVDSTSIQVVNGALQLAPDQPRIRSLGGLNQLSIQGPVTSPAVPTIANHLANKAYVDSLTYMQIGNGLTRSSSSGAISLASQIVIQDLTVQGQIDQVNIPLQPSHVVNKEYLTSLQWLNVDPSLQKDTASQTLRLATAQPNVTSLGTLASLAVSGPVSCSSAPTRVDHLVTRGYVESLAFLQTGQGLTVSPQGQLLLNGVQAFTDVSVSYNVVAAAPPTLSTHLVNRAYVDGAIASRAPSAATFGGGHSVAPSNRATFAMTVQQTAPFAQDILYVRDSQAGDTFTILKAGVFAFFATMQSATSGICGLVKTSSGYLQQSYTQAATPSNISFIGYLAQGSSIYIVSPTIDTTSSATLYVSRV